MKRMFALIVCILCFSIAFPVFADVLTIDTDNASYEEIVEALHTLETLQLDYLKDKYISGHTVDPEETIQFRGIPLLSIKKDVELIMGSAKGYSSHIAEGYSAGWVTSEIPGLQATYYDLSVAGYLSTFTELNYVYPVQDDILIRDDDLAIFVSGMYRIYNLGDIGSAVEDLTNKLNALYGSYTHEKNDRIWTDDYGNYIRICPYDTSMCISYYSSRKEQLFASAKAALAKERAKEEEQQRIQNENNYDGL